MNAICSILAAILVTGLAFTGHGHRAAMDNISLKVVDLPNPAPLSSEFPNLTAAPDGAIVLSWLEAAGAGGKTLRFSTRRGDIWTATRTVTVRNSFNRHPAVLPEVIMLAETSYVSYWTQIRKSRAHAEDLYASASQDGGLTWTKPVILHRDRSAAEHSLVSMTPVGRDRAAIVWLDGREEAKSGRSMLMQITFDTRGLAGPEVTLDPDVCSCCPTSIVRTTNGMIVAYRDRTRSEIRDISILQFKNGGWSAPRTLNQDGWRINGCPTNGVDLATDGSRIAAAWFTAADEKAQVKAAFSNDAGETFTPPIRIDEGAPIGRASVALLADGVALVSWIEKVDLKSKLMVRAISADGRRSPAIGIATARADVIGYPRIKQSGKYALIAWVGEESVKRVRTAIVSIAK